MTFSPSLHQQAFKQWVTHGKGNCILDAVAGSGKTTTIFWVLDQIPEYRSVQYLMFNANIAKEANAKLAQMRIDQKRDYARVRVSTFHSLGYGALRKRFESTGITNIRVDANKMRDIMRKSYGDQTIARYGDYCTKLVGFAKGMGIGPLVPDTDDAWWHMIKHHDLFLDDDNATEDEAITIAREMLAESVLSASSGWIDFDDQLYMPLVWNLRLWQNDWVFIDEAQDTNNVRRAIARLALRPTGRLVAVGDEHQAIYGFTGATNNALDLIQEDFNAKRLPLSVCYRCAYRIVEEVQDIVPHIEAAPDAVAGDVKTIAADKARKVLTKNDAILCRNTAPLISLAYDYIAAGTPVTVLGREIGQGLINIIKKRHARSLPELERKLNTWADKQIAKFTAKGQEQKAQGIADKRDCIIIMAEHLADNERSINGLIDRIDSMFSDDGNKLTLSTVHKAKGREWPTVAILRPDLMPSPWARQEWQIKQEFNLIYVAKTRAMQTLIYMKDAVGKANELTRAGAEEIDREMMETQAELDRWEK